MTYPSTLAPAAAAHAPQRFPCMPNHRGRTVSGAAGAATPTASSFFRFPQTNR
jgi:hypothetical protein